MNWDDLQYFLAVCRRGSVSGAASLLQVNHSTVLRRLANLEGSLGVTLFDRLPGGYALTSAGNELAESLGGVVEQIESAQRQLMGADLSIQGVVRLTTTDTLAQGLLMPTLAAFRRQHPQVQLQLVVNNSFSSLTQREADVAVRGTNRPPDNLVGRHVGTIRTGLYASRAYLKTLGRRPAPDDHRWVAPDDSLSHLEQAKWLRANVPAERIAFRADTLVGMVEAVAQGLGVGLLLCPLADARPELTALAPPSPSLDTQLWVLTHPDLRQVARVRAFAQFLVDALSSDSRLQH